MYIKILMYFKKMKHFRKIRVYFEKKNERRGEK